MNRKKKIEGLPFYKSRIFLIVLAAVVVLCGVGILWLRLAGYRHPGCKRRNPVLHRLSPSGRNREKGADLFGYRLCRGRV